MPPIHLRPATRRLLTLPRRGGDSLTLSRQASTTSPAASLNKPTDFRTTPLLHHTSSSALSHGALLPAAARSSGAKTAPQTLHEAVNSALRAALAADDGVLLFGEDVAFGGVFRCSAGLAADFGGARVFNTPLTEQGIVGFGIGAAAQGLRPVAEVQFADYVYPAFDQLVNEAAKMRYRAGSTGMHCGGLVVRMPCGGVGHGALWVFLSENVKPDVYADLPSYHSQSPESLFTHIPGLTTVIPRSPSQAKGLLLTAILRSNDPVLFLEPKILYRAAREHVPIDPYFLPLNSAEVLRPGHDCTVVSYGAPLYACAAAIEAAERDLPGQRSVELIDLRTIYPWDRQTIIGSVNRTGRLVVVHESMVNAGVGAEVAATVQEHCFTRLEAPVQRVAGWTTHMGLVYEQFIVPDVVRIYDAIKTAIEY